MGVARAICVVVDSDEEEPPQPLTARTVANSAPRLQVVLRNENRFCGLRCI
jgi:hypothetical protein